MTRISLAFAAVLLLGGAVCAQQPPNAPKPHESKKSRALPVPSWNVRGHAEEIPNLTTGEPTQVASSKSSSMPVRSCLIVAKHGTKYDYAEARGGKSAAPSQKRLDRRDLKNFKRAGGVVQILPAGYNEKELQAAENACLQ